MTKLILRLAGLAAAITVSTPAVASWTAGNGEVAAAAKDARIAGALAAVDELDQATISDDRRVFAARLADDLAVNNPQNGVSVPGATAQRSAAGQISYSRYDRIVEYPGMRGDMVLLMGAEIVQPKGADGTVRRRFTDLWKQVGGRWLLTARQATIISPN